MENGEENMHFYIRVNLTWFSWFDHLVLHGCGSQWNRLQIKWCSVRSILHISIKSSLQTNDGHLKP